MLSSRIVSSNRMKASSFCGGLAALIVFGSIAGVQAEIWIETNRFIIQASAAFENGQEGRGIKLDGDGGIVLYDRVLVEDDGPGIGSDAPWLNTQRAPVTEIIGNTRIKKVLHIDRLGAREARFYAPIGVKVEVNGQRLEISEPTQFPKVPVS